jgi:hypothetical protein
VKNENPPVTILLEEHPEKVRMLYRDVLAERLGVSPKERLTESQLKIFQQFLGESGLARPRFVSREAGDELAMAEERPKKSVLTYIQRDLEQIKHALDKHLRPFKNDVKNLREDNNSLRANVLRIEEDREKLGEAAKLFLLFIRREAPHLVEGALGVLLDPSRSGWKKFRKNWLHRLGIEE